ncbi:fumarylacetoacetate hydrolase family protein [Dactylosporangium sp. NPDC049525]|uniref:fumarylacetoacetate hydrolase family protein n=1 Tax=Dactylosporangium sp. NPDC049525 TaxID=3154730 RepID=UPI003412694F
MRLALFDDYRLGIVDGDRVRDVTAALPYPHDPDPLTAGWWRALCRDFADLSATLAGADGPEHALADVRLRAPVLNPSKIIAAASNYAEHVAEMHGVQERTLGAVEAWMMSFDVFLKATSSIAGPGEDIVLPAAVVAAGHEIHHESELVVVIGTGGRDIPVETALEHVFGYTVGLDITVRSPADRSRRKSYDTFSPLGPWVSTTADVPDPQALTIDLTVNGATRQHVHTADMLTGVAEIVAYASACMTLLPGDVVFTGAPPGVGPIAAGDDLRATISGLGELHSRVR